MSANVIIFDGLYTAEQMRNLDKAKNLLEEAIDALKKASLHEGWKCKESEEINEGLNFIRSRLDRVTQGIERTGIALGKGLQGFAELEERAANQANTLSNDLKNKYGFNASTYGQDEDSKVPVTLIPESQEEKAQVDGFPSGNVGNFVEKISGLFNDELLNEVDPSVLSEEDRKKYEELLELQEQAVTGDGYSSLESLKNLSEQLKDAGKWLATLGLDLLAAYPPIGVALLALSGIYYVAGTLIGTLAGNG